MADPILDSQKAAKLIIRRDAFNNSIDAITENLFNGRITLRMWEEDFRTRMREYMWGAAMIGKGDPTAMTQSDRGKTGAELKKQYKWLHGFAKAIQENADTVTLDAIKARAHLYGNAGVKLANEVQAGYFAPNSRRDPEFILPWIPGDGSTKCLNNCGCRWILTVLSSNNGSQEVQAVWTLDPIKDHCKDCVPRDGHTEIVSVPADVPVPEFIGLGGEIA